MASFDEYLENGKLFTDDKDREYVESLPELQRERILNERFQKIKDLEMKRKYQNLNQRQEDSPSFQEKLRPRFEDCKFVIPRDLILKNVFKPFINIIKGTFVRAIINKSPVICKIVGIRIIDKYLIDHKGLVYSSLGVDIDVGNKIIEGLQLMYISSSKPLTEEVEEFINKFMITDFEELNKKSQKVIDELNRSLTDSEITKMIENRLKDNPKKLSNTEKKIHIISKRDEAIQMKDKEKAIHYQNQLEKIEDEEKFEREKKSVSDFDYKKGFIN